MSKLAHASVNGAGFLSHPLFGTPWWVVVAYSLLLTLWHGADAASKWLDVWERIRQNRES